MVNAIANAGVATPRCAGDCYQTQVGRGTPQRNTAAMWFYSWYTYMSSSVARAYVFHDAFAGNLVELFHMGGPTRRSTLPYTLARSFIFRNGYARGRARRTSRSCGTRSTKRVGIPVAIRRRPGCCGGHQAPRVRAGFYEFWADAFAAQFFGGVVSRGCDWRASVAGPVHHCRL